MDIWEANRTATQLTAHPCNLEGSISCNDEVKCGDGDNRFNKSAYCDKDGCDLSPYRIGDETFFGEGKTIDSGKPMSVVTQFITSDGTDNTDVVEIKRFYVQDGKTVWSPESKVSNLKGDQYNSISDDMCERQKEAFGDTNDYKVKGGMKRMSDALGRGVVLVMSLWDDHAVGMKWLDATYPDDSTAPGSKRGPCAQDSGDPDMVENTYPNSYVRYSNIMVGEIGSTHPAETYEFLQ